MNSFTCLICPNGCGLSPIKQEGIFLIRGNRCSRGIGYAADELKKQGITGDFKSEKPFLHYKDRELKDILSLWNLPFNGTDENQFIQGSPERSLYRNLVYAGNEPYILEQLDPAKRESHESLALRLVRMKKNGLPVSPFKQGENGKFVQIFENHIWQLTPFVKGQVLNRNSYGKDEWRGRALGDFICSLYETERIEPGEPVFDLVGFIYDLVERIVLLNNSLKTRIVPIINRLEESLFPHYDNFPSVFGHGDPHPLNIIWGEDRILSLIDWEFSGTKPLLYDASLIMGCVGSESPQDFDGPFNRAFYNCLQKSDLFPSSDLKFLPSLILAQRFAWLNEWLRHDDSVMIKQELTYMEMLL